MKEWKINRPETLTGVRRIYVSHTLNEILPYLPEKDCFFDTRHWVCATTDDILPFAVTTRISSNNQQFLIYDDMEENNDIIVEGNYSKSGHNASRIVNPEDIAPTVMENHGTVTAVVEDRGSEGVRYFKDNVCGSLRAQNDGGHKLIIEKNMEQNYRIRKLTPRECFRLMGVDEENIDRIQGAGISNSQQYKLAGNSIVVDVMEAIFGNLFSNREEQGFNDTLF